MLHEHTFLVGVEVNEQSLCDVLWEASPVDWNQVIKTLELPTNFSHLCLIEVLLIWRNQQSSKDPWMIWRKLAALIEGMKGGDSEKVKVQLGIGYKLRQMSGVGRYHFCSQRLMLHRPILNDIAYTRS